jgi:hypothetical protein
VTPQPGSVTVSYRLSTKDVLRLRVAAAPVTSLLAFGVFTAAVVAAVLHPGKAVGTTIGVLFVALILDVPNRFRALTAARHGDHTVVADSEGLTYTTPSRTTTLPWRVWAKPRCRFDTWVIPLSAAPHRVVLVPRWLLRPEDDAALAVLLADKDPEPRFRPRTREHSAQ